MWWAHLRGVWECFVLCKATFHIIQDGITNNVLLCTSSIGFSRVKYILWMRETFLLACHGKATIT